VIRGMIQRASGKELSSPPCSKYISMRMDYLKYCVKDKHEWVFGMSFRGCWVMSDLGVFSGW